MMILSDKIKPDDVGLMDEFRFSDKMNGAGCWNPPIITCKIKHDCNTFTIIHLSLPMAQINQR
jgi:cysteamine dioxygenase